MAVGVEVPEREDNEVIHDERSRAADDQETHGRGHICEASHKALQKRGEEKDGHEAEHDFSAGACSLGERLESGLCPGKEESVPHDHARRPRNHDDRELQRAVNVDDQRALDEQVLLDKQVVERPDHDAILKQDEPAANRKEKSEGEREKRHADIVERDAQEHVDLVHLLVHRHRVAALDI